MALRRLCKSGISTNVGQCPAVYVDDEYPEQMVCQGPRLADGRRGELREVADAEDAVGVPTETVLRAAALYLAERGHPEMRDVVERHLSGEKERVTA